MNNIPVTTIHITNTESKIELLKEWETRKGNESWTLDDIAELIASAHYLAEERIIKLLEEHQPSELGRELGVYPCTCGYDSPDIDLTQHHIALIKGEK